MGPDQEATGHTSAQAAAARRVGARYISQARPS